MRASLPTHAAKMQPFTLHKCSSRPLSQRQPVTCASSSSSPSSSSRALQQQESSRRQFLLQSSALLSAISASKARADVEELERQLPGLPVPEQQPEQLPKSYQRTMHKLVNALRTSIEAEAGGAKEVEVRRKADPAKDLVKEFVRKWQDNAAVAGDVTHEEMKGALSELGRFYQKNGPRSRLNEETKQSVLTHLAAVDAALPAEEKSLLGL